MKLTAILIAVLAVFVVGSNSSLADQFAVIKKITDAFGAFAVRVDRTVESNASRLGSVVDSYVAQFRKFRDDAAALVRSYVGQTATGAAAVARRYAAGFASIAPVVTATDVRNLLVEARNLGTSIRKQFINDFTANIQGAVRYPKNIIKCLNASTPAIQTGLDNLANRIDSVIAQEESKLEGQLRTLGDQVVAYENALLDNIRAKCSTATCAVDEVRSFGLNFSAI